MQYMLLIYNNDETEAAWSGPERGEFQATHRDLIEEITLSGELVSTRELDQESARVVRVPDGNPIVTDGPFAETKEYVGGYYLVDVTDEARAVELAQRLIEARTSLVEVRRVVGKGE